MLQLPPSALRSLSGAGKAWAAIHVPIPVRLWPGSHPAGPFQLLPFTTEPKGAGLCALATHTPRALLDKLQGSVGCALYRLLAGRPGASDTAEPQSPHL